MPTHGAGDNRGVKGPNCHDLPQHRPGMGSSCNVFHLSLIRLAIWQGTRSPSFARILIAQPYDISLWQRNKNKHTNLNWCHWVPWISLSVKKVATMDFWIRTDKRNIHILNLQTETRRQKRYKKKHLTSKKEGLDPYWSFYNTVTIFIFTAINFFILPVQVSFMMINFIGWVSCFISLHRRT